MKTDLYGIQKFGWLFKKIFGCLDDLLHLVVAQVGEQGQGHLPGANVLGEGESLTRWQEAEIKKKTGAPEGNGCSSGCPGRPGPP